MGMDKVKDLLEFFIGFFLIGELLQLYPLYALEKVSVARDEMPHLYESIHDMNADIDSNITAKNCRQHSYALFCKGVRWDSPPAMCGT